MNIPAGYEVRVTSWENDGDNYNTKSAVGCSREKALVLVKLLKAYEDLIEEETLNFDKILQLQFNNEFTADNGLEAYFMNPEDIAAQEDPNAEIYFDYPVNGIIYDLVGYCGYGSRIVDGVEVFYHEKELVGLYENFL